MECTCEEIKYKLTARGVKEKTKYRNQINRIIGQLNGIKRMIEEDRYCGDVLIQISAATNSLKSVSEKLLHDHLNSCVLEKIKKGDENVMDEVMHLFVKLSK